MAESGLRNNKVTQRIEAGDVEVGHVRIFLILRFGPRPLSIYVFGEGVGFKNFLGGLVKQLLIFFRNWAILLIVVRTKFKCIFFLNLMGALGLEPRTYGLLGVLRDTERPLLCQLS